MMDENSMSKSTCWTCRLRHKKCDQDVPVCGNCAALGIDCHSGHDKPRWMDGGASERAMTGLLKAQVKRNARRRRAIGVMRSIAHDLPDTEAEFRADCHSPPNCRCSDPPIQRPQPLVVEQNRSRISRQPTEEPLETQNGLPPISPTESELGLITAYMDYVFPILFPFYRPHLLQGGRSWLLTLSMNNQSFLRSVVSLSSMYLSIVPAEVNPGHAACASIAKCEMRRQADMALAAMQRDLGSILGRGVRHCLSDSVRLLASIVQLLSLELTIAPENEWQVHLNAAVDLFGQIMEHHGGEQSGTCISHVMHKLGSPSQFHTIYSADQCAFAFCLAFLQFCDIIAATTSASFPRLQPYRINIALDESSEVLFIRLQDIAGCEDWVLQLLGNVAALVEWKKNRFKNGHLIRGELLHRGGLLDDRLEKGLKKLDNAAEPTREAEPRRPLEMLRNQLSSLHGPSNSISDAKLTSTRIWAYAVRIYLFAILMDGRLEDSIIRSSVGKVIRLIKEIKSPVCLRLLIWPICISGCYATEDERGAFRDIEDLLGDLGGFGTVQSVFDTLEKVWAHRDIGTEFNEVSDCLQISGHSILFL